MKELIGAGFVAAFIGFDCFLGGGQLILPPVNISNEFHE